MAVQAAERALKVATSTRHTPEYMAALLHSCTYHQGPDGWSAPHYVLRNTLGRPVPALEIR
jgi:3-oxoacyl-[acyl-carrier-protein] synthase-3